MKQLFYAALAATALAVAFTACKDDDSERDNTPEGSMTLGGVTWASVNVDDFQTFAAKPDMYTKFYQWNRSKAWSATDSLATGWNATHDTSSTWTVNPCPEGWRLPTAAEYMALDSAGGEFDGRGGTWAEANERGNAVAGRFYGVSCATCSLPNNMVDCLFFPASGYRNLSDGTLYTQGEYGYGWSSTSWTAAIAFHLNFHSNYSLSVLNGKKSYGFPVRCIRDI